MGRGRESSTGRTGILLSPADNPLLRATGIYGEEARWLLSASLDPDEEPPGEGRGEPPAWLRLSRPEEPGPSTLARTERAVRRHSLAEVPAPVAAGPAVAPQRRPRFREVWTRLCDPTLHRPFRITCWRMLHARLGCNAFMRHVLKSGG